MVHGPPSTSIPFFFLVSLVEQISSIKPRKADQRAQAVVPHASLRVVQTFQNWVAELHRRHDPLPPGTTAVMFRLLFPDEDMKRKYGMQETRLAQALVDIAGVYGRRDGLVNWRGEEAMGCLGLELRSILEESSWPSGSGVDIFEVDAILSSLASKCTFSADSIRAVSANTVPTTCQTRSSILRSLYSRLSAAEAGVITQIILKDLRPLLYPLPEDETHYRTLLIHYKSNALEQLSKFDAMRAWDPSGRMVAAYQARACLDEAALAYEGSIYAGGAGCSIAPKVGIPIQIPKCTKGQGCAQSLQLLCASRRVWAETKYDGERTQIHVELGSEVPKITIYSKSGRESTMDRVAIHPLILEAVGFASAGCKAKRNIVLEAEMVAYSNALQRIDEFWRIRSLITTTAVGPRHAELARPAVDTSQDTENGSQCSLISNASNDSARHLALVFFDILLLDDESLLSAPYSRRREILESVIFDNLRVGHVMLAERTSIDMVSSTNSKVGAPEREVDPEARLRTLFARLVADHQEGVVLKAEEGKYNDWKMPWVKLKKDYIEGYGDTLDLVLVGAAWEKERARELRVAPTAYTTFYIGALANSASLRTDPRCLPHFEVFFKASYGLSREDLEQLNFRIKNSNPVCCEPGKPVPGLSYTYNLFPELVSPAVFLPEPILAEVVGGSFTKAARSKFYELRFPRIVKVFRPSERSWAEGTTLEEFQKIAREAVGHEHSHKDVEDWCAQLWGKPSSPGVKCPVKRKQAEAEWAEKLELSDGKIGKRARKAPAQVSKDAAEEENQGSASIGSHRSSRASRTLGSMTNVVQARTVLAGTPSRVDRIGVGGVRLPSPPSTASHLRVCIVERDNAVVLASSAGAPTDSPAFNRLCSPRITGQGPVTLHGLVHTGTNSALARGEDCLPTSADLIDTPLGQFLRDAIVWIAVPRNTPRPAWRVPSTAIIPAGQQVHGLESLLRACDWHVERPADMCRWVARGVVFVDDTGSQGTQWTDYPLKALLERRSMSLRAQDIAASRPVWVFSVTTLSYAEVRRCCTLADVESRALCRLG